MRVRFFIMNIHKVRTKSGSTVLNPYLLFGFSGKYNKKRSAKSYLNKGWSGNGESDFEKRNGLQPAHNIRNGKPYTESADDTLCHNEGGIAASVEIADEAEEEGHQQAVNAVGAQTERAARNQ